MTVAFISTADDLIAEVECEGDEVDANCPSGWRIMTRWLAPDGSVTVIIEANGA